MDGRTHTHVWLIKQKFSISNLSLQPILEIRYRTHVIGVFAGGRNPDILHNKADLLIMAQDVDELGSYGIPWWSNVSGTTRKHNKSLTLWLWHLLLVCRIHFHSKTPTSCEYFSRSACETLAKNRLLHRCRLLKRKRQQQQEILSSQHNTTDYAFLSVKKLSYFCMSGYSISHKIWYISGFRMQYQRSMTSQILAELFARENFENRVGALNGYTRRDIPRHRYMKWNECCFKTWFCTYAILGRDNLG